LAVLGDDEIGEQTGNRHGPRHESQEGTPRAFDMNLAGHGIVLADVVLGASSSQRASFRSNGIIEVAAIGAVFMTIGGFQTSFRSVVNQAPRVSFGGNALGEVSRLQAGLPRLA
jgi:hypothetical protein